MKQNIGKFNKRFRLLLGITLLILSVVFPSFIAALLGVYALLTGLLGWCPVKALFKKNRNPGRKTESNFNADSDGRC